MRLCVCASSKCNAVALCSVASSLGRPAIGAITPLLHWPVWIGRVFTATTVTDVSQVSVLSVTPMAKAT